MRVIKKTRILGANFLKVQRQKVIHLSFYFLMGLLCILGSPVLAKVPSSINSSIQQPINSIISSVVATNTASIVQQGKFLYDTGKFAQAVEMLQQAIKAYRQQGDNLELAATLSNLSLTYQQLGEWNQAQQAITESLNLLKGEEKKTLQILAQSLNIQGSLQLSMGRAEAALATWEKTEAVYKKVHDQNGVVRSLINQAQAWQAQGFYPRAIKTLEKVSQTLKSQRDSKEKTMSLRSLGDALLVVGNLKDSRQVLEESLTIARNMQSSADIAASLFSLGNNARKRQDKKNASAYYQQAVATSASLLTKVQAQLNLLSLLIEDQQWPEVQTLLSSIEPQLDQLPLSRASIYAQINYAQNIRKVNKNNSQVLIKNSSSSLNTQHSAVLLANAIKQSHTLGDKRTEAYAFKSLGGLYEESEQWLEAQDLTLQGLALAQSSNAPEITYTLEWQLGRLLRAQKDINGAIAAYDAAVETLQPLRKDLIVNNDIVNQDVQFNFRDSVEPVYRQSVELLLQSQQGKADEKILDKARERIEALQLAELDDFFREACLQGQKVILDKVVDRANASAAIIYPIILPQELQVIVKIPKQPLQNYSTKISQSQVEELLVKLRKNLVNPTATKIVKTQSQEVYNWLLKPIELQLKQNKVNTLVFVLDGVLRNIPMSALYDGNQYLVQKYAISLSVGLQLIDPKPLVKQKLVALTAGLTQPPPGFKFSPLLGIKFEFDGITKAGVSTTSLLDGNFKKKNLENEIAATSFNIVHLATHGQFSSRLEDTFILDFDGQINVKDFDTLFRTQSKSIVELLVLSACQTAAGDSRAALGLAGAAVRAGARSTIASLWQIDDKSTAMFVSAFYQELKSGKITKAEAVHRAQLTLLKHPNYKAPSFWSSYVLIGNWL
ncbi:CHAT domain-containing protein [Nostoc sp. PA-18-2419]|uniref:CHAT domain-containing protein n=1 Tax=Nostoc sp. PA-18-2419 TaxID=2575443 RepID=UPI001108A272|nr:CHAT domain-containing protein [Nostoc sp. PA-18-2419]